MNCRLVRMAMMLHFIVAGPPLSLYCYTYLAI